MTSKTFDVIVVGAGAMGLQTCWELARRGVRVLGLDRASVPNDLGSSHGEHRIIRLAYFEHPLYVPLLRRAYQRWRELERAAGEQLLFITGSLDIGRAGAPHVEGALLSCREHDLSHEYLNAVDVMTRHPGISLPADYVALAQPDGGFLACEAILTHTARLARAHGAVILEREAAIAITRLPGGGMRVTTTNSTYEAGQVVMSAGAWIGDMIPALKPIAVPERQVLGWFKPHVPDLFTPSRFPVSLISCDVGLFYQFPIWQVPGVKIGLYHHLGERGEADVLSRETTPRDEEVLRAGLERFFPAASGEALQLKTCLFTNTPDEHFILDRLPEQPEITIASPCSGHGFKFASVIGEILADMVTGQQARFDITPFRLSRFLPYRG